MANTINTDTYGLVWRIKYFKTTLEHYLRKALVAEAICTVDRSDQKYISNPYVGQVTASVTTMAGTYAVTAFTTTDQTLEVTDQVTYGEHLYEFETTMSRFDLWADRVDEIGAAVATAIDKWCLNTMLSEAGSSYTTPTGGFTTAANFLNIMGALQSLVAGYADNTKGTFLVIENTDLAGIIPAMGSNGFSTADSVLRNGFMNSYMGTDLYVVRTGTFATATANTTAGTKTWTNSGHRMFGVKGVATYACPRGIHYDEKQVTLKTGRELSVWGNIGSKVWTPKATLIVDITLA